MQLLLLLLLVVPMMAQSLQDCRAHRHYGRTTEAAQCFTKLAASSNAYTRAEGLWGLRQYADANKAFRIAVDSSPKNADYRVRWGRLFLERFNKEEAEKLFREALAIDENNPGAVLGLAMVASDGYESKAVELAEKAIELDPKLAEAEELLAQLALEDNNPKKAAAEADTALKLQPESLDAMAIHASIDLLGDNKESPWIAKILKINPVYGDAYATIAHFFVLNRRYEEGIKLYRKAIELDPELNHARTELGVNLMRLGEEKEAREQLVKSYESGYRDALTVNSLTLLDSYKNFVTFKTNNTTVKLHKKEAELLRPYIESELKRAIATYEKKYKMKLEKPVQVEVYPDHEDFAVRTLGMPGLGALGVTFGYVVAMDSPSGRRPGTFHWDSTLWHELSHVFVLTATGHKVPRWFTEGMAVHEETAASPDWGDRLDPEAINAIQKKKLLPIAQLDRGFIRPSYPSQVVVSYFQAGKICDYIAQKWSYDTLLAMIKSFAEAKSTPQVIEEQLKLKPEEFDKQFLDWLTAQTKVTVNGFAQWREKMKKLSETAKENKPDDVIRDGLAIRDLYPEFVESGSVYEMLADAYAAKGDKLNAMRQLERYSSIGGRSPTTVKKLAVLQEEAGKKAEAAETLQRLNYIYPMDDELHRKLGDLWMATGNTQGAIMEYRAVIAGKPLDPAMSHYNLARALRSANRVADAKEELLLALEAAPGYRPAQRLLLEMNQ
jgi:tetratricopeptide (TPR) repeat protein